jgi:putative hemolysin
MNDLATELIFIFLLIMANGLFSMSEMAIVSARKARLQQKADKGDEGAKTALELATEPTAFLSTVQIGITLIGILTGVFGGAGIQDRLAQWIQAVPFISDYSQGISNACVVICITFFSLVIGELAPKRIALSNPEKIASISAPFMKMIARLGRPAVRILSFSTDLVLGLLRVRHTGETPVTEEEIKLMIEQGTRFGVFQQAEQDMISRVFRLDDLIVTALMTPRPEVVWLDLDEPVENMFGTISESRHFCFPVANGNLDNVTGVVYAKDLLAQSLVGKKIDISSVMQPPLFVPESMPAMIALEKLKAARSHIALVIDEYGGFHGLVTLNDFLEAIVGDIPLLDDEGEADVIMRDDGSWLLDGRLIIDDFKELFQLENLPGEDSGGYQTLGGFIVTYLGCIPTSGDHFEWHGLRIEVVDMDARRIDKVLVTVIASGSSSSDNDSVKTSSGDGDGSSSASGGSLFRKKAPQKTLMFLRGEAIQKVAQVTQYFYGTFSTVFSIRSYSS